MAMNAHKIFNSSDETAFLKKIRLHQNDESKLREGRDEIRKTLKEGLQNWQEKIAKSDFIELSSQDAELSTLQPKFRMQGSFTYHTANDPAQKPPQEIDLDDGLFLPISFLEKNGDNHPAIISKGYFRAVELILEPLCNDNNWTLITNKGSCVRVQTSETTHIDIALYAIPDDEFITLVENRAQYQDSGLSTTQLINDTFVFADEAYQKLASDQIMLAHRDNGWVHSDPRKLENWFKDSISEHGEQVRYVSRYLKAWRDNEWDESRLASIALMSATVEAFANSTSDFHNRDDLALMAVTDDLANILRKPIWNPVIPNQRLDQGWSEIERSDFVSKAEKLADTMREAIKESDTKETTIDLLKSIFGSRLSENIDLISDITAPETKSVDLNSPAVLTEGLFKSIEEDAEVREAVKVHGDERYA